MRGISRPILRAILRATSRAISKVCWLGVPVPFLSKKVVECKSNLQCPWNYLVGWELAQIKFVCLEMRERVKKFQENLMNRLFKPFSSLIKIFYFLIKEIMIHLIPCTPFLISIIL